MRGLISKLHERLRLRLWQRHQHDSVALRTWFREQHRIDVGMHSYGCFDQWRMPGPIRVGRYCSIASSVRSAPINHPYDAMTTHPVLYERKFGAVDENIHRDAALVIEDDVWIGHNVMILPGCKFIGRGAIVGAGALVTRNVAPYTIVAGNPARPLRAGSTPDLVEALEESRWWELEPRDIRTLIGKDRELVFHPTAEAVRAWTAARSAAT